jgi:Uma2 family endonuclease
MATTAATRPAETGPMRWTRAEYQAAHEAGVFAGRRVQLVDGEIIEMAAMKKPHALALARVRDALLPHLPAGGQLHQQVPISLWADGPADGDPEPDGLVLDAAERPVLAIEISDTTLRLDLEGKAAFYARATVPTHWVLDLNARRLHVHTGPTADGGWQLVRRLEADEIVALPWSSQPVRVADLLPAG